MKLSEILEKRGFVYQHTGKSLAEITDGEKRTVYLGIDPTADSAHAGNLSTYMMLRHFAADGHKVILLVGGGTGLIGDPKETGERPLADADEVKKRAEKLTAQVKKLVGGDVTVVNNADWLTELKLLEFLRDTGKHFTVNALIKKDIMSRRLETEEPLSFTEFSYPLLQAYDYFHLNEKYGVDVQIGGSDQWANVTAGVELIHKKTGKTVHALTHALVIDKKSGKKFGKSEGNAVWLDPEKTSPFQFYQFWLNQDDGDVREHLLRYTELSIDEIDALMREHEKNPGTRGAQKALAGAVCELIHGKEHADTGARISEVLFGNVSLEDLAADEQKMLKDNAPNTPVKTEDSLVDVLIASGLAASKREAREFIESGAVTLGKNKITDVHYALVDNDFQNGLALLRRGKRNAVVLVKN